MRIDNILVKLGKENSENELWPKAGLEDLALTESLIGIQLPESYRQFVLEFSNGANLFGIQEVSAVGESNKQIGSIHSIFRSLWLTARDLTPEELETGLEFREGGMVKRKHLVPFSLDKNGNQWCFLTEKLDGNNEYPVAYYDNWHPRLYGRLENFAAWLRILLDHRREVIRVICDDDVIIKELDLG